LKPHSRNIRWGIIGLGRIAHEFAQDLQKVPNCSLYAVASRSQEKADDFGALYGAQQAYGSYELLMQDDAIDAIYIATPHVFHKEHTIQCLNHKKPVLCEKPFAMNVEEVSEMIACAQQNEVLLMEALWTAFLPHFQHVLRFIKSRELGDLRQLSAGFSFAPQLDFEDRVLKKELGGGAVLDIGIYPVYAALASLGLPDSLEAKANFFHNGADSDCMMVFHYPKATANLSCSLIHHEKTEAKFLFEKGQILIHSMFHKPNRITIRSNGKEETLDFGVATLGYSFEIDHFNQLIREGLLESDVMTHQFSLNLIRVLDAIRKEIGLSYE
tara:strand:+ start:29926 stop:30906 length:981 start_codon:yes stop_codon:yes gene_type:complete